MSTAVPIQRGWYRLDAIPFECGVGTLGKEYAILLKKKKKIETRIKTMSKFYFTEGSATICCGRVGIHIAMTVGGKTVVVSMPKDIKIGENSDDYLEGDSLADWLNRNGNGKELQS